MKSSCFNPGTNRPFASDTVAVTLISSTPLLNRKLCSLAGGCCACDVTAAVTAIATITRKATLRVMTLVHMRDHGAVGAEADAIAHGFRGPRNVDEERRFAAAEQRRVVDRRASAGDEAAVGVEQEDHDHQSIESRADSRIPDDAAHDQVIAVAFLSERNQ